MKIGTLKHGDRKGHPNQKTMAFSLLEKGDLYIHVTSSIIALTANHLRSLVMGFREGKMRDGLTRGKKWNDDLWYISAEKLCLRRLSKNLSYSFEFHKTKKSFVRNCGRHLHTTTIVESIYTNSRRVIYVYVWCPKMPEQSRGAWRIRMGAGRPDCYT